ncbi:hypothetical protein TELCIR_22572, partial [Teladorsagia circumcincta]
LISVSAAAAKAVEQSSDSGPSAAVAPSIDEGATSEQQKLSLREPPSTTMYPSLPSSVTMQAIPADQHGEHLSSLSDTEWEGGEQAYPSDYLNLLRDDDKIQVFAAPEKAADYQMKLEERRRQKDYKNSRTHSGPIESFADLVEEITKMLNEDKQMNNGVKVHISVKVFGPDGKEYKATTVATAK